MPYTNNSGINIYYEMVGDPSKPILLMNHGLGNSVANWYSLGYVEALSESLCLLMYDGRGFGKSEKCYEVSDYHPKFLMNDITSVLDAANVNTCHYFGNSRGGILGIMAAHFVPDRFKSFIIAGADPHGLNEGASQFIPILKKCRNIEGINLVDTLETSIGIKFPEKMGKEYDQNDLTALSVAAEAMCIDKDYSEAFKSIQLPRLMYVGSEDVYCAPMKSYASEIGIDCEVIDGFDHANAYWRADTVTPIIKKFIQQLSN